MKISFTVIAVLIISIQLSRAQAPQHYNFNATNNPNTFPFAQAQGKMVQWLVAPGEFNQPTAAPSGNITSFSIMIASSDGPAIYTNLFILVGQTTLTSLPAGGFYTGQMDTVFKRSLDTLSGTLGSWLTFTFDTPHSFDSTKSLVIQIEQCGVTGSFASFYVAQTPLSGNRRCFSAFLAPCPWVYFNQATTVLNCGVNISTPTGIHNISQSAGVYSLSQNYPNPFNPSTNIKFSIPKSGNVKLSVFDILGREVTILVNEFRTAGIYAVDFDASSLASGVYFYRIEANEFTSTKNMLLVK